MAKCLMIIIAILMMSSMAYADSASHKKACEELIKMWNIDKMIGLMLNQVKIMQDNVMAKYKVPDDMKDINAKYIEKINELIKKEMSWDSMKEDFMGVYMEVFSETEIREIINFYNSPIGKKTIEKSPELMLKVLTMSQSRTQRIMPEIEKLTKEMSEEIKQRSQLSK